MRIAVIFCATLVVGAAQAQTVGQQGMSGHGHGHGYGQPGYGQGSLDFKLPPDPRAALEIPPHVRDFLRFEMRGHLEQLSTLMARIGEGNFREAGAFAKSGLAVMGAHPPGAPSPGAFMPPEFRALGQSMHQAAAELANVGAAAAVPPTAQDWKAMSQAVSTLTAACAGCHGSFRLK